MDAVPAALGAEIIQRIWRTESTRFHSTKRCSIDLKCVTAGNRFLAGTETIILADYTALILRYYADPDAQPLNSKELAIWLGVKKSQWSPFKAAIEQLIEAGAIRKSSSGILSKVRQTPKLVGTIKRTTSGTGYFRPSRDPEAENADEAPPETEPDEVIYIEPGDLQGAMTGDTVEVGLSRRRRAGGQRIGRVLRVIERARSEFVGTYHEKAGRGYVTVDAGLLDQPVSVGDPGAKGARPNDKVVVEILKFPTADESAEGVLTKVLGTHGQPGIDCLSIIHEFNLPDEFPEPVLEAARDVVRNFNESDLTDRLDLTQETIITIDPVDARDFDDAISLTEDKDGHWRLGVHIADVSHFVQPGTPLDREAKDRGTSVYLPDRVLPMLPELISNGLASLQEGHVRYTKSVFIDFNPEGLPTGTEFANSAIKVMRRFAYEEVMPILEDPEAHRTRVSAKVRALLDRMHRLAMTLRRRRFSRGALDLQLPEVKIDFDENGRVSGAHRVSHDESHQIIEEFMLAANIAVATKLSQEGLPYLHRTHAAPDEGKLRTLGSFVKGLGFDVKPWVGRQEIQKLLDLVRGQPAEQAISYAVLRSMKQAEYSPAEVGHFALAEDFYCHFTSPIRRYPDLLVHRLFDGLVRHGKKTKAPSVLQLVKLGEHCSETERRAESAERELIKVKLLEYLKDKIGWQMQATITGVERFGLFCLGIELPAEGLVHVRNLPQDQYDYDEKGHVLVGRKRDQTYRLGDRVTVEVARVDTHKRTLDYRLVLPEEISRRRGSLKTQEKQKKVRRKRRG
ncbi:ribonuclease R [bacterium]|nr:ribonuclease R [bacterium]